MELSKEELDALNWVASGCKVECEEDEDNVINAFKALGKIDEIADNENSENILPRPVVRDGNGKLVKEGYDFRDWYLKLQEEFFEMAESSAFFQAGIEVQGLNRSYERLAEELADIITVCISYLDYLDYDEKARSELFASVNEKNENRGYFKESD